MARGYLLEGLLNLPTNVYAFQDSATKSEPTILSTMWKKTLKFFGRHELTMPEMSGSPRSTLRLGLNSQQPVKSSKISIFHSRLEGLQAVTYIWWFRSLSFLQYIAFSRSIRVHATSYWRCSKDFSRKPVLQLNALTCLCDERIHNYAKKSRFLSVVLLPRTLLLDLL